MRRRLGGLLASLVVVAACTSSPGDVGEVIDPTASDDPVAWSDCGEIECGRFTVPIDHVAGEASGVIDLVVYRRQGREGSSPLLLVGPRTRPHLGETRWSAKSLAERAELVLGPIANDYDVVAVALRGAHDMVMPTGAERFVGSLDVADDLELLRREGLAASAVPVIGWGDGATAVAAWAMQRPGAIRAAVLDSPVDPGRDLTEQERSRIESTTAAAERAVRWCASHLSCPVNSSPTDNIELLMERIDQGSAPEGVSTTVLSRASETALSDGKPNDLWRAISEAAARRGDVMAGLAGPTLTAVDAAPVCRDVGSRAGSLEAVHAGADVRYFAVGARREALSLCDGGTAGDGGQRPLGTVESVRAAKGLRVLVTASSTDPVVPASVARAMAKRLGWTWRGAVPTRHLVVGVDRASTRAVAAFLVGD